jgi:hypothetical protein
MKQLSLSLASFLSDVSMAVADVWSFFSHYSKYPRQPIYRENRFILVTVLVLLCWTCGKPAHHGGAKSLSHLMWGSKREAEEGVGVPLSFEDPPPMT